MNKEYSLADLSEEVKIRPRTIRSYIKMGMLRGPDSLGRNAKYGEEHLIRLKVIKVLRDSDRESISAISRKIMTSSEKELLSIANRFDLVFGRAAGSEEELSSAPEYIQFLKSTILERKNLIIEESQEDIPSSGVEGTESQFNELYQKEGESPPAERLIRSLEMLSGKENVSPKTRGEHWMKFDVTPALQISIKGIPEPEEISRYERIADLLREIIMGGE
jgi:DNA-binding transcriptional MerR regulator